MRLNFPVLALAWTIFVGGAATQATVSNPHPRSLDQINAPISTLATHEGGRLIVRRSPTFGNKLVLRLSIDGQVVANVARDGTYSGHLSPGPHVLTALAVPKAGVRQPASTHLTVHSGHTYTFVATWESDQVVLRRQ